MEKWPADDYVCLMADFCCDCVWDREVVSGCVDELPLSQQLQDDILAWAEWYDRDCDDGMPDPRPFPRAEFAAQGLTLARRIKAELPAWTVVFVDNVSMFEPPYVSGRKPTEREITLEEALGYADPAEQETDHGDGLE